MAVVVRWLLSAAIAGLCLGKLEGKWSVITEMGEGLGDKVVGTVTQGQAKLGHTNSCRLSLVGEYFRV